MLCTCTTAFRKHIGETQLFSLYIYISINSLIISKRCQRYDVLGFSRLAEVLQCKHIVSTSTAALAHLLPSRTFTCRSRLKSLTTQGCACERKTRLFRPSPDMKELHGKSHVDRSNSVLDDLIFEEVVKKGEAGHIKRKVLPCLDPKRRLTRPFTTFCNNTTATTEIQRVSLCTAYFRCIQ